MQLALQSGEEDHVPRHQRKINFHLDIRFWCISSIISCTFELLPQSQEYKVAKLAPSLTSDYNSFQQRRVSLLASATDLCHFKFTLSIPAN